MLDNELLIDVRNRLMRVEQILITLQSSTKAIEKLLTVLKEEVRDYHLIVYNQEKINRETK